MIETQNKSTVDFRSRLSKVLGEANNNTQNRTYFNPALNRSQPNSTPAPRSTPAPAPTFSRPKAPVQNNGSIVDFLNSSGQASDFGSRAQLAQKYGISNYRGTAQQNTELLRKVSGGGGNPVQTPTSSRNSSQGGAQDFSQGSTGFDNSELAELAGKAGLSFNQYQELVGKTSSRERKEIADELGISELEASVFSKPRKDTERLYREAYRESGLRDLKREIEKLDDDIAEQRALLADATSDIDANPFLIETSRVGRGRRVLDQAETKINNLISQQKAKSDLYNRGLDEIDSLISRTQADFKTDRLIDEAKLKYLQTKAEGQFDDLEFDKASEGLESFVKGKNFGSAPKVVGSATTGYYQYDATTGRFIPLSSGTGGSGSGGGKSDGSPSDTPLLSFEEFVKTPEAEEYIREQEEAEQQSFPVERRNRILQEVYKQTVDEIGKAPSTSEPDIELKNLTSTNKRDLALAGLDNAPAKAKSFFISSPASFRDLIKRGVALGEFEDGMSLEEIKEIYDAWEASKTTNKSSSKKREI